MSTIPLTLGPHWDAFIRQQIATGRYGSPSELVRDALRELQENTRKTEALMAHLGEGAAEAARGDTVANFSMALVIADADAYE